MGVRANGVLTDADYKQTLIPLLEKTITQHGHARLLVEVSDTFAGWEMAAAWDDATFGLAPSGRFQQNRPGRGAGAARSDTFPRAPTWHGRVNMAAATNELEANGALWQLVRGDIVAMWRPDHFDSRTSEASRRQTEERAFYVLCSRCRRMISQILAEGAVEESKGRTAGRDLFGPEQGLAEPRSMHTTQQNLATRDAR